MHNSQFTIHNAQFKMNRDDNDEEEDSKSGYPDPD